MVKVVQKFADLLLTLDLAQVEQTWVCGPPKRRQAPGPHASDFASSIRDFNPTRHVSDFEKPKLRVYSVTRHEDCPGCCKCVWRSDFHAQTSKQLSSPRIEKHLRYSSNYGSECTTDSQSSSSDSCSDTLPQDAWYLGESWDHGANQ